MGAGRPLQPFRRKRSQEIVVGPKNALGLKVGLKAPDMVWVEIDEPRRWWTYPAETLKVFIDRRIALGPYNPFSAAHPRPHLVVAWY